MAIKPQTITITNFSGRLTRFLNGDLNSGFAKFTNSFGYDPFSKPMNLTWLERPQDIAGPITDLPLAGKVRFIGETNPTAYVLGSSSKIYRIQISSNTNSSVHSVTGVFSVLAGSPTYVKGGAIEFFGSTGASGQIYIGSDSQVNRINFDGSGDTAVGNAANYMVNVFRPFKKFIGKLIFGNGITIGAIDSTGTVTSPVLNISATVGSIYSELNPPPPIDSRIRDLEVSPDNNYLLMASSDIDYESISNGATPNQLNTVPAESRILYWNGSDQAITAATTLSTNLLNALQTYLQKNHFFTSDSFGAGINNEDQKLFTLINNKPPFPNATGVNGNFIFWSSPERRLVGENVRNVSVMYYFGSLDAENPPGLWRMFLETSSLFVGNVVEMPLNILTAVQYSDLNSGQSSVITAGVGTHYYSVREITNNGIQNSSLLSLKRFHVPPRGGDSVANGVYETQTQFFSKRIGISQIRVYTEPTIAGNAFQLDMIGSDGNIINNGTFTYSFGNPIDSSTGSSSLERINFNPDAKTLYSLGIRITNTGTTNMTIKKIEIDYTEEGK